MRPLAYDSFCIVSGALISSFSRWRFALLREKLTPIEN